MNPNRVLSAFIGICVVTAAAQAQRGGARAVAPTNVQDVVAPLAATQNVPGRGAPAAQTAWWTDTALMARLGLTDLQKSRIESSFLAYKQNLTSAKETLEKEEAQLSRLLDADSIDRSAVQLQTQKVILARGEMERLNAAMTLEMREQLTRAQWVQLQQPNGGRGGRGGGPVANPAPDSFAAKYAADKPITLEGTVTEFKFQDPHSFVIVDAAGRDGRIMSWTGELAPATLLARQGWTATTLKPGDRVVIQGAEAHDPSLNAVNVRSIRRLP